jgi:hypothetical protein
VAALEEERARLGGAVDERDAQVASLEEQLEALLAAETAPAPAPTAEAIDVEAERAAVQRARQEAAREVRRRREHERRVATVPRERPSRRRAETRWLPSERVVGLVLLLVGLTSVVLLLIGLANALSS